MLFITAHHLSTSKRAGRILVIENGAIAEMGSHAERIRAACCQKTSINLRHCSQ